VARPSGDRTLASPIRRRGTEEEQHRAFVDAFFVLRAGSSCSSRCRSRTGRLTLRDELAARRFTATIACRSQ
jgi:hypothetical protein